MTVELPAPRTLTAVLRAALARGDELRLVVAAGGTPFAGGTADFYGYVNVVVAGVAVKAPRLAGTVPPDLGGPAYLLASRDFMLYIGTAKTTA